MTRLMGPYEVLTELGAGGMGIVYEAYHQPLGRTVALKLLPISALDGGGFQRFQREMKLVAGLSHPNLVRILDGGIIDDTPYLAMELLAGESLCQLLAREPILPLKRARAIAVEMGRALAFLHEHGIIHRDLKPSNVILLPDGTAKLIDFGLVRRHDSTAVTAPGEMVGTLPYMAPELVMTGVAGPASDMWAIGCVFYQMLTGQRPFKTETQYQLLTDIRAAPIRPPRELNPEIPGDINALILELLQRPVESRLASAALFVERLRKSESLVSDEKPLISIVQTTERSSPVVVRGSHARWAVGLALLAVIILGSLRHRSPADRPTSAPELLSAVASPQVRHRTLFDNWHRCESLLHLLKYSHIDSETQAALVRATGVDLGSQSAFWGQWVHLGRWLEAPDRPPAPPRSVVGHVGALGAFQWDTVESAEEEMFHHLWRGKMAEKESLLLRFSLDAVTKWPEDGRGWLALGRLFDLADAPERAVIFYELSLKLNVGGRLEHWHDAAWAAYARALLLVPHHDLEREWLAALVHQERENDAFDGLLEVLGDTDRSERLLIRCTQIPSQRIPAYLALAGVYQKRARRLAALEQRERAARVYELIVDSIPDFHELAPPRQEANDFLFGWYLDSGAIASADNFVRTGKCSVFNRLIYNYCTLPPREVDPAPNRNVEGEALQAELMSFEATRLLEIGAVDAAVKQLLSTAWPDARFAGSFRIHRTFDVLGAGGRNFELEKSASQALFGTGNSLFASSIWTYAAFAMSLPAGRALMEQWIAKAALRPPTSKSQIADLKSLWFSLTGRMNESLSILTNSSATSFLVQPRAIWEDALGFTPNHAAAQRAIQLDPPAPAANPAYLWVNEYIGHIRRGRFDETVADLAKFRRDVRIDLNRVLLEAWTAAWSSDAQEFAVRLKWLRIAAHYRQMGIWVFAELDRMDRAFQARARMAGRPRGKELPQNAGAVR